ncbi:hypothetical protein EPK84_04315 (plasmid) [Sinorhizobium fredii]|nr:hypothetical protein EPK84_04315 [Sinorhizobium fredii]
MAAANAGLASQHYRIPTSTEIAFGAKLRKRNMLVNLRARRAARQNFATAQVNGAALTSE